MTTPAAPHTRSPESRWARWLDALRVYREPASLRMLTLGFAAGLPLLLVLGTLSFRLREAGVDRATIGHLSWVGLAYGFKWLWAPLVDRTPIPLLTHWLGRRRSWLLVSQLAIATGLAGMAVLDPRDGLQPLVLCALLVAFASATQDIALDAFRIESASTDKQAALAACYQTGYRIAMIWAGAGVLWLAASQEVKGAVSNLSARCQDLLGQAPTALQETATQVQSSVQASASALAHSYSNGPWQFAYLIMAASMAVGVLTVLRTREPLPSDQTQADNALALHQARERMAHTGTPWAGVLAVGVWLLLVLWFVGRASKLLPALWVGSPWLLSALGLALSIAAARRAGPVLRPAADSRLLRALAWVQTVFVAPFAEFIGRYRWQAVLVLALVGTYRISDVVMGVMANPFYVDMCFTKEQVANVTKVYGVLMTLAGAFLGGLMAMRFGVMRVLGLGALLSALTNLAFAWLAGQAPNTLNLILVVSADNLAGGIASAAFVAYLSALTNVRYSATQYALFSSMMLLAPKFIAGFSGEFVDAFGYSPFFGATALLGLPVLLLVWLASSVKVSKPNEDEAVSGH